MSNLRFRMFLRRLITVCCLTSVMLWVPMSTPACAEEYLTNLSDVAGRISAALEASHVRGVSVLDFTDLQGTPTELGRFFAEELSNQLVLAAKQYSVVDRNYLNLLLKEHNLSQDGLIDPRTRRQLGNLIGIDTVIVGVTTLLGKQIRLSARAVSVETGKIIIAANTTFFITPSLENLNDRGVRDVSDSMENSSAAPKGTGSIKLTPNLSVEVSSLAGQRNAIVTTFTFRNKGNRQISLALNSRRGFCADMQLSDARGGYCEACANGEVLSSLPVSRQGRSFVSEGNWAQLAPMSTSRQILNFYNSRCNTPIRTRYGLSLSGTFLVDEGHGRVAVPVSFSGMEIYVPTPTK